MGISQIDRIIDNQIDNIIKYKIESVIPLKFNNNQGLYGVRYIGYFNDEPTWFLTGQRHGSTNYLTEISGFSSNSDLYSWEWTGYFKPSTTEPYTFYSQSDDASYIWVGTFASTGYTVLNATVNCGGLHGVAETSGTINLNANQYYPIRIQFGDNTVDDVLTVSFSTPTIPKRTNGLNYYFNTGIA